MNKRVLALIAILITLITVIVFLGSSAIKTSAENGKKQPEKSYLTYQVKPGDSLWTIAEAYRDPAVSSVEDYIREVKKVNDLSSDRIICGKNLILIRYTAR